MRTVGYAFVVLGIALVSLASDMPIEVMLYRNEAAFVVCNVMMAVVAFTNLLVRAEYTLSTNMACAVVFSHVVYAHAHMHMKCKILTVPVRLQKTAPTSFPLLLLFFQAEQFISYWRLPAVVPPLLALLFYVQTRRRDRRIANSLTPDDEAKPVENPPEQPRICSRTLMDCVAPPSTHSKGGDAIHQ